MISSIVLSITVNTLRARAMNTQLRPNFHPLLSILHAIDRGIDLVGHAYQLVGGPQRLYPPPQGYGPAMGSLTTINLRHIAHSTNVLSYSFELHEAWTCAREIVEDPLVVLVCLHFEVGCLAPGPGHRQDDKGYANVSNLLGKMMNLCN